MQPAEDLDCLLRRLNGIALLRADDRGRLVARRGLQRVEHTPWGDHVRVGHRAVQRGHGEVQVLGVPKIL